MEGLEVPRWVYCRYRRTTVLYLVYGMALKAVEFEFKFKFKSHQTVQYGTPCALEGSGRERSQPTSEKKKKKQHPTTAVCLPVSTTTQISTLEKPLNFFFCTVLYIFEDRLEKLLNPS